MDLLELAKEAGINPQWVAGTQGGEYKSSCPKCGGTDRFFMQPNRQQKNCIGYYACRQCEISGDTIQFCRDILGQEFNEALKRIGITIPKRESFSFSLDKAKLISSAIPRQPNETWINNATALVECSYSEILKRHDALAYLAKRGISLEAVKKNKLGWISEDLWQDGAHWEVEKDKVWLPKGILIPTFKKNKVVGLKVRRSEWKEGDEKKYVIISGSTDGMYINGETNNRNVMVVVESELDAIALQNIINDFGFALAVGSSMKNPDILADYLAKQKPHLFICYDNDDAGKNMLNKWQSLYAHAIAYPTPIGKDIGEAIEQGFDIKTWIISKVSMQMQYDLNLVRKSWNEEDQALVNWALHYISERTISRFAYNKLEQEINMGPDSPRAKTGELQSGLRLMKHLVEQENKITGNL
ncbi:MAG: toprim domain-containing protein [Candidatus Babeliaceae bacterium]|jgi:DNA primase